MGITQQVYKDGTWHFRHEPPGGSTERRRSRSAGARERGRGRGRAAAAAAGENARNGRLC